ncbi:hypothetical protein [Bdellovibrio sp. HCB-110]|uniref:DUF6414 family protein n=1 Tax=Bdellovibrio sp. HCB-110 TaxID=3391182 RepID=UPI0039B6D322
MSAFLPDLLYCDRKSVISLLSVLVDNLIPEYKLTINTQTKSNKDLSFSLERIAAKYANEETLLVEREGLIKRPTASLFNDLYQILNEKHQIQSLAGFDDAILGQLRIGEIVELPGTFTRSELESYMGGLIEMFTMVSGEFDLDKNAALAVNLLKPKKATYVVSPLSNVATKFVTSVDLLQKDVGDDLIFSPDDVDGEFTVLGRVRRINPIGKSVSLYNFLPGKLSMQQDKLRDLFRNFKGVEEQGLLLGGISNVSSDKFEIPGPVIEINPIAIYQSY